MVRQKTAWRGLARRNRRSRRVGKGGNQAERRGRFSQGRTCPWQNAWQDPMNKTSQVIHSQGLRLAGQDSNPRPLGYERAWSRFPADSGSPPLSADYAKAWELPRFRIAPHVHHVAHVERQNATITPQSESGVNPPGWQSRWGSATQELERPSDASAPPDSRWDTARRYVLRSWND